MHRRLPPYASIFLWVLAALPLHAASLAPDTPTGTTQAGLNYQFYTTSNTGGTLPDFTSLWPTATGQVATVDITPATQTSNFSFQFSGYINVPTTGTYTFYTTSDDGSRLFIGPANTLVVDNNFSQGATERSGTIDLQAGKHLILVQYGQGNGGYSLSASYSGPGIAKQTIPTSVLSCVAIGTLQPRAADNPTGTIQGLIYKFYTSSGSGGVLPDFTTITPASTGTITNFLLDPRTTDSNISFQYTGYVTIPSTGTWTFYTASDDGSRLYIGPYLIVDNNYSQGITERSGSIQLAAGRHAIKVQYGQGVGGFGLTVSYAGPTVSKVTIPNSALSYAPLTATPVIAPANPKIPATTFSMSITDATPGAIIYYTTNGADPTISSTVYNGTPVSLSVPITIKAMAKAANYDPSLITTINYVTALPPANDNFANAILLSGTLPITATGTNLNATWETSEPNHGEGDGRKSIWYKWVAPSSASYIFSTAGSAIDTTLGIYTGTAVNALTKIGDNDDALGDNPSPTTASASLVTISAVAGTTYSIAIDGFGGAEGSTSLTIKQGSTLAVVATIPNASETGPVSGQFTITRTGDTSSAFFCNFSLDGTATKTINYQRVDEFISFAAGQSSATVTITPVENFLYTGPLTVTLTLTASVYAVPDPTKTVATVTITDNETTTSGTVNDTSFSPKRGFYNAPIDVAITTTTSGATIRYTLDGTLPTPASGTVYTAPIHITGTTTLRALAYKAGKNPTNVDTHTYLFTSDIINQSPTGAAPSALWPAAGTIAPVNQVISYGMDPNITTNASWSGTIQNDMKTIPSFCVSLNLTDLFGSATGIYANPSGDSFVWERPCSLELIDPNTGTNNFGALCGIRLRGGYSRNPGNPKHAFRFFFRSDYNKGSLQQPIFGPSPAQQKIDAFDLRCDQNYSWSGEGNRSSECFIRDNFSRDSQLAMSGFGCRGDYYHLYLNGTYWGLYNADERGEAGWASNYFGGSKPDWDVIKTQSDTGYTIFATNGTMDAWNRLWKACKSGLSSNDAYYRIQGKNADGSPNPNYENLLEVDDMIDYMLVIYYGGNLDCPISNFLNNQSPNNCFAQRNRNGNAGFRFTVHDAEHTLLDVNQNRLGPWPAGDTLDKSNAQWIFQQCEANAEFRIKVADHLRKHFFNNGALTPAQCIARFSARMAQLDRAVVGESARWGDSKTTPACNRNDWLAACNNILNNYFPTRTQIVINQFIAAGLYPNLSAPNYSQYGGSISSGFACTVTNPNATGRIYYTVDGSDPRSVGGAIAPTAIAGGATTSSVTMNGTVTLRSRVYDGTNWSALQDGTFIAPQDFSTLKVTEIMYNPPDFNGVDGQEFEFLEMKNTGAVALNLSGAQFTSGIGYTFPSGSIVNPGQIIVLVANPAQFAVKYPGVTTYGTYLGRLNNSGATLTLTYSTGATIFSFAYNDATPWPVTPDGLGFSLVPNEGAVSSGQADYNYWRASTNTGGSPGTDDPIATRGKILINEALTHVSYPNNEYIELFNAGTTTIDISGWYLTDDRHTPKKYRIPNGTSLAAGGYYYVLDTQYNSTPGVDPNFALDSHGEEVYVFSADSVSGALTGYAHGFKFGAAQNPVAFGRYTISTGADHFVAQISNTPGAVNSGPRVGPIVFTEVMYQPAAGGDPFIELVNITNASVPLYDPSYPANTWQIDGIGFVFPLNASVPANSTIIVVGIDPTVFRTKYSIPLSVSIYGPWTVALSTTSGHIELQKPDNPDPVAGGGTYVPYVAVDTLDFTSTTPWPQEAAGTGPSLVRINGLTYGNDPINWKKSPNIGGSPGTTDALIPKPPSGLTASTLSNMSLYLTWIDNSSNETSFTVQRSLDGTNWSTLLPLGANVTSYQNNGLSNSTLYYYRVYASNSFGDSAPSNIASATTLGPQPPAPPSNLVAIPVSPSKLRLEWGDGSIDETGFALERSPNGFDSWASIGQTPVDNTVFIDSLLTPDTTYYYRVKAFNPYGESSYANVAAGHTLPPRLLTGHTTAAFARGHIGSVFVDLNSPGNEQQLTFSLRFDATALANPVVVLAGGLGSNATLSSQVAGNTVGITVGLKNGATFPAGIKGLVEVRFDTLATGQSLATQTTFVDAPAVRGIFDASGQAMEVTGYQDIPIVVANRAPISASGSLTTLEDQPMSGTLAATDADNDALTYSVVTQSLKGLVTITNPSTGAYTYTPGMLMKGSDSFTFVTNDGIANSNIATISITIAPVNHAPGTVNGTFATLEDTPYLGTLSASDIDGDSLVYSIVTPPNQGTLTITNTATGAFTYVPSVNANGADSFTFKANDGTVDSNVSTISITITPVNDPPVSVNGSFATFEDTPYLGTLSASDVDGNPLVYSIVTQPSHGSVTITNTATGAFTYVPNLNANGLDSFTFKANDSTVDSNVSTVSITITPVNDPPISFNGSFVTLEDTTYRDTLSALDVDGNALVYSIVTNPSQGTVTITNTVIGAFTYVPNANANGSDSFTFKVNDGTVDSNVSTVSITITPVNDPPVAVNGSFVTLEDTSYLGTLSASDVDGNALFYSIVTNPIQGTVTITNAATGAFTYVPNLNANGLDSFTFKANNGAVDSNNSTISIAITPINDPPVALPQSIATLDSKSVSGVLHGTDVDGNPLTFRLVSTGTKGAVVLTNASTGEFTYSPSGTATGTDPFTFIVNDGQIDSAPATVTMTINPTAPALTSNQIISGVARAPFAYSVTASGTAPIQISATALPPGLSYDNGVISGTPTAAGTYTIQLSAANAAGSITQPLTIVIANSGDAGNMAPVIQSAPTMAPSFGTVGEAVAFSSVASDANGDQLDYNWDFGDGTSAQGAIVKHVYSLAGVYNVSVTISDGAVSISQAELFAVNESGINGTNALTITKATLALNFIPGVHKDSMMLTGTIPLDQGAHPAGMTATIKVGTLTYSFMLDKSGKGAVGKDSSFKMSGLKNGVFATPTGTFVFNTKNQILLAALKPYGIVNATIPSPGKNVVFPAAVELDGKAYTGNATLTYTSKAGKAGSGKHQKN